MLFDRPHIELRHILIILSANTTTVEYQIMSKAVYEYKMVTTFIYSRGTKVGDMITLVPKCIQLDYIWLLRCFSSETIV